MKFLWPGGTSDPTYSYGAVPQVDVEGSQPFSTIATVVHGTPSIVKLTAPAHLPAGYECPVEVLGHPMVAVVPSGGVVQGQEFQATVIPLGAWRDGFFDCLSVGLCRIHCCLALWCTPLALGQVMTRLNLTVLGTPKSSAPGSTPNNTYSTFALMAALLVLYVVVDWSLALLTVPYLQATEEDEETGQVLTADELYMPQWVVLVQGLRQLWELVYAVFVLVVLFRTRRHVRQRYEIPPSLCRQKDALDDAVCVFCCGPCTVCQMARHVTDYRQLSRLSSPDL